MRAVLTLFFVQTQKTKATFEQSAHFLLLKKQVWRLKIGNEMSVCEGPVQQRQGGKPIDLRC